jgi:hypothetical protein
MKHLLMTVLLAGLLVGSADAAKYDLRIPGNLLNSEFRQLVREAGMLAAYRGVAPAEPQGITGFDIGVEASFIEVDSPVWDRVLISGDAPSYLAVPRLHLRKGLPFNLDIGASYATVVDSNIELLGAELQWAILEGTAATPALAVRGSYSTLRGVSDLDLQTMAADLVVSKGFLLLTPYLGAGVVRIDGKYDGADANLQAALADQKFSTTRVFGGVQVALALLRLTVEAEYAEMPIYTAKLSLGW